MDRAPRAVERRVPVATELRWSCDVVAMESRGPRVESWGRVEHIQVGGRINRAGRSQRETAARVNNRNINKRSIAATSINAC